MPRANRCFLPGNIWRITHRSYKKEFLLKFLKKQSRIKCSVMSYMVHLWHEKQASNNDNTILLEKNSLLSDGCVGPTRRTIVVVWGIRGRSKLGLVRRYLAWLPKLNGKGNLIQILQ